MFLLLAGQVNAQRILGYFPDNRNTADIQWDKITDIAFSFVNPKSDGTLVTWTLAGDILFSFDANKFNVVKSQAAESSVDLWLSTGGADDGEQRAERLNQVSGNPTARAKFVSEYTKFASDNGCSGLVIDWEFPKGVTPEANHLALLEALKAEITAKGYNLKVAIAVGGEYKGGVNHTQYLNTALFSSKANLVDEWHIMAYDLPSGYNANHSSLSDATQSVEKWNSLGVPYNKMLLAVPFYARNSARAVTMYKDLTGDAATNFTSDLSNGFYYNGKTTLEKKADMILDKGALGVVIWDLGQDKTDQYSLLGAIEKHITGTLSYS